METFQLMKHARLFQNILGMEKAGHFRKMPGFFFKRLKLDNLKKSRAFSKKALLFPEKALLFRLKLRTQKSIPSLAGRHDNPI